MITKKLDNGLTEITRGDGTIFTYRAATSPTDEELANANKILDYEKKLEKIIEETCQTYIMGGYFYPEGYTWMKENWGIDFVDNKLFLHPVFYDFAYTSLYSPLEKVS